MHLHEESGRWHLQIGKRTLYVLAALELLFFLAAIAAVVWGVAARAETVRLREEQALHARQLEMARTKLEELQGQLAALQGPVVEREGSPVSRGGGRAGGARAIYTPGELLAAVESLNDAVYHLRSERVLSASGGAMSLAAMQARLKQAEQDHTVPSLWPAEGEVTDGFGWRPNPFGSGIVFHQGIDIAGNYGTPIRATASGRVKYAGWQDGYGNLVELQHDGDIATRYGHNSVLLVREGEPVQAGAIIALMGSTGNSTGVHVHYEVRIQGTPVDPRIFLPAREGSK